jgi:signal transduction histidine kinase
MRSLFFLVRILAVWAAFMGLIMAITSEIVQLDPLLAVVFFGIMATVLTMAFSHIRRVRLISSRTDLAALGSRHRQQIEIPFPAAEAFDIVDGAIRDLPNVDGVESSRDSLQVHARVRRFHPYERERHQDAAPRRKRLNLVFAAITPSETSSSLVLVCEPERGPWLDWFLVDHGTNLQNIEAIARAVSRRVAERRGREKEDVRQTATEKELTVARLSLLHAQVEPHFLYNTLASAQLLTRSDPARADQMLGNLITYLRHSLPRTDDAPSTLGEEVERARAYLEILKIRMGERLSVQIQVPASLEQVPMPPMMLQTLVENSIKHGLEPVVGGGTIWVLAREADDKVLVTVADDGRGFSEATAGTGIGLKNLRERLRLAHGDAASFSIVSNFPKGVAATIAVPRA